MWLKVWLNFHYTPRKKKALSFFLWNRSKDGWKPSWILSFAFKKVVSFPRLFPRFDVATLFFDLFGCQLSHRPGHWKKHCRVADKQPLWPAPLDQPGLLVGAFDDFEWSQMRIFSAREIPSGFRSDDALDLEAAPSLFLSLYVFRAHSQFCWFDQRR